MSTSTRAVLKPPRDDYPALCPRCAAPAENINHFARKCENIIPTLADLDSLATDLGCPLPPCVAFRQAALWTAPWTAKARRAFTIQASFLTANWFDRLEAKTPSEKPGRKSRTKNPRPYHPARLWIKTLHRILDHIVVDIASGHHLWSQSDAEMVRGRLALATQT